jgi:hypothetical protein
MLLMMLRLSFGFPFGAVNELISALSQYGPLA